MKIVHLNTSRVWGGGEQQILDLMRGLRARDVSSVLLARSHGALFQRVEREPGLTVLPFDFRTRYSPLSIARLRGMLRHLDADVLHLHDGRAVALGVPAARALPDLGIIVHRRVSSPMRRNPLSQKRYRSSCVDAFIAVSESARGSLRAIAIDDDRIEIIPSGVDTARLCEGTSREAARAELGLNGEVVVGTVSALEPKKDIHTFVRAAAILATRDPRMRFIVIGEGSQRTSLMQLASSANLAGRLTFTGRVPDAFRLIKAMDVFVFPSLREGSPGVVKEAMSLGVPVVAARAPGTIEVVADGMGVLVPAGDADATASAVDGILANPSSSGSMARTARRQVEEQFSIADTVDRTVSLYERVAERRSGKAVLT